MKRLGLIVSLVAALTSFHATAADCLDGHVAVTGWSATFNQGVADVRIGLRDLGQKDIDMLKGSVTFSDPFGDPIEVVQLRSDTAITAGAPGTIKSYMLTADTPLLSIDKNHITATVCVTNLLLADGELIER